MKVIIFSFIILISTIHSSYAVKMDGRRREIIEVLDEELKEVKDLYRQENERNPKTLHRLAELYLEKARVIKEAENDYYLSLSASTRRKAKKARYFKESSQYFLAANKICKTLVRRFKRYRELPDIYYILAYNAKEFGHNKTAKNYFRMASKQSPRGSITRVKADVSLAEIYYNNKQYYKAIPLYERSLRDHKDQWWTKDSFNLAWCYFRTKKYSSAINKMKQVHSKSSGQGFADMRSAVIRDIGFFYAVSGRIKEGIDYYKDQDIDFAPRLLEIAQALRQEGNLSRTKKVLVYAEKYNKEADVLAQVYIEQLEIYQKQGSINSHYQASYKLSRLLEQHFLGGQYDEKLKFHVAKQAAILQRRASSKTYRRVAKKRLYYAKSALKYFALLEKINPAKRFEYKFLEGEVYYIMPRYKDALDHYLVAEKMSQEVSSDVFRRRSLEAALATLGQRRLSRKVKNEYYIPVYERYLAYRSQDKTARKLYPKLFKVYLDSGMLARAENILTRYRKNFSNDHKTQEAMIANIMEAYRKRKDEKSILRWIAMLEAKEFIVSARYMAKIQELLTSMQMKSAQSDLASGKKHKALMEYHRLIQRDDLTRRARANALFNLSVLYFELSYPDKTYQYSSDALNFMTAKEARSFSGSYMGMSNFLFELGDFDKAVELNQKFFKKVCKMRSKDKIKTLKNTVNLLRAQGRFADAFSLIDSSRRCGTSSKFRASLKANFVEDLIRLNKQDLLRNLYQEFKKSNVFYNERVLISHYLYRFYEERSLFAQSQVYLKSFIADANNGFKQKKLKLEAIDLWAKYQNSLLSTQVNQLLSLNLSFPEKTYNFKLKNMLTLLDKITAKASDIQNIESGRGIVQTYLTLLKAYAFVSKSIKEFRPPGKSQDYINSFSKAMTEVWSPLESAMNGHKRDLDQVVRENEILSDLYIDYIGNDIRKRMTLKKDLILMGRRGK